MSAPDRTERTDHSGNYDVAVIGGGPAGAAAARLLASWTRRVVVLTRPAKGPTLAESLPPSCRKLFDAIGVLRHIDAAGFLPSTGNTVWWGEDEARSEHFADGLTGYQVRRGDFDALLLEAAADEGAAVQRDAAVREVVFAADGGPSEIRFESSGTAHTLRARLVLDCSGRAGVVARRLRVHEEGSTTVALVGVWDKPGGWNVADESHTLVESYRDGWAWSVPVSPTTRYFTTMVDPRVTGLQRDAAGSGSRVESIYRAELAKARHLDALLEGAEVVERPFGCDASLYSAERFTGDGFLLVGDAASFIDPLSSFGVKKAMASGWMAAVVANTCIADPAMTTPAMELYDSRERAVWDAYRRRSAAFFEEAAANHDHAFWTGRADVLDRPPEDADTELDVAELRADPAVLAAFEALKQSASIDLVDGPHLERVERPAIRGNQIVAQTQLQTPDMPAVRFLRGVDVTELAALAGGHDQVPDLYEAYNRRCRPATLPDFLGAVSVLLARGALVNRRQGK